LKSNPDQNKHRIALRLGLVLGVLTITAVVTGIILARNRESAPIWASRLTDQMSYEVINVYPSDAAAFTQGLIYLDGNLYESTGLYGQSSLRRVDLESGEVLQKISLSSEDFGEGLTAWEDILVQLTWREGRGYVYDPEDFSLEKQFNYDTEGWGLTHRKWPGYWLDRFEWNLTG